MCRTATGAGPPAWCANGDGKDEWIFEDQVMGMVGLNAVVTWPKEQWGMNPSALAEMRPAPTTSTSGCAT